MSHGKEVSISSATTARASEKSGLTAAGLIASTFYSRDPSVSLPSIRARTSVASRLGWVIGVTVLDGFTRELSK